MAVEGRACGGGAAAGFRSQPVVPAPSPVRMSRLSTCCGERYTGAPPSGPPASFQSVTLARRTVRPKLTERELSEGFDLRVRACVRVTGACARRAEERTSGGRRAAR